MSHELDEELDGRDIRKGGFSWTEDFLDDVFAKMIGADAARLYQVLCRMIPDKQRNPLADALSVRRIVSVSRLSQGTVDRKLKVLVALGMVTRWRPVYAQENDRWEYKLPTLRELVQVGRKELLRRLPVPPDDSLLLKPWLDVHPDVELTVDLLKRLPVPPGNALLFDAWYDLHPKYKGPKPEGYVPQGQIAPKKVKGPLFEQAGSPEDAQKSVPPGNAADSEPEIVEGEGAYHQTGGSVPADPGGRTTEGGGAYQGDAPIVKHLISSHLTTPLPPQAGNDGGDGPLLTQDDLRYGDPEFLIGLGTAARWVRGKCGISNSRVDRHIEAALELRAKTSQESGAGDTLQELAKLAVANWKAYGQAKRDGLLIWRDGKSFQQFLHMGLWCDQAKWDWVPANRPQFRPSEGMRHDPTVPAKPSGLADSPDWIRSNADTIEAAGLGPELVAELREIAAAFDEDKLEEIEARLSAVEKKLTAAALEAMTPEELETIRTRNAAELAKYRDRMPPKGFEQISIQLLEREVLSAKGLPKLSLFFMPRGA